MCPESLRPFTHGPARTHPHRDWYFIAEQPAPAPHLAHLEGCGALRIVLVTAPRVSRSCEHFPEGFDLHLLPPTLISPTGTRCVLAFEGSTFSKGMKTRTRSKFPSAHQQPGVGGSVKREIESPSSHSRLAPTPPSPSGTSFLSRTLSLQLAHAPHKRLLKPPDS